MRITIIGNCYSTFVSDLVEELRKNGIFHEINGFMFSKPENLMLPKSRLTKVNGEFDNIWYPSKNVRGPKLLDKIYRFACSKIALRDMEESDIINIHYLSTVIPWFWKDIRKKSRKVVISIWGSDFYQTTRKALKKYRKIFNECDALTFTNERTREEFVGYYKDLDISNKTYVIRFGLRVLDILKKQKFSQQDCRNFFGLPVNKIITVIGYSSRSNHRHEEIITYINKLDKTVLEKMFFVLPMTYGDFSYREKIKKVLLGTNLSYKILEDFMTYEEMARFVVASDIMINLQTTDQFSGSMQEHMYAGNVVITGDWLPYDILWSKGAFALRISEFSQLTETLVYAVRNLDELKNKSKQVNAFIYDLSSWSVNIQKWIGLYNQLLLGSM